MPIAHQCCPCSPSKNNEDVMYCVQTGACIVIGHGQHASSQGTDNQSWGLAKAVPSWGLAKAVPSWGLAKAVPHYVAKAVPHYVAAQMYQGQCRLWQAAIRHLAMALGVFLLRCEGQLRARGISMPGQDRTTDSISRSMLKGYPGPLLRHIPSRALAACRWLQALVHLPIHLCIL